MKKEKSELEKDLDYYKRKSEWFSKIITKYQEENKKLKSDLAFERTMLDNVRAEYKSSQNVIKKLKEEIKRLEFDVDAWHQLKLLLEGEIKKLEEEKQAMKEEMEAMERTLDHLGYGERTY